MNVLKPLRESDESIFAANYSNGFSSCSLLRCGSFSRYTFGLMIVEFCA